MSTRPPAIAALVVLSCAGLTSCDESREAVTAGFVGSGGAPAITPGRWEGDWFHHPLGFTFTGPDGWHHQTEQQMERSKRVAESLAATEDRQLETPRSEDLSTLLLFVISESSLGARTRTSARAWTRSPTDYQRAAGEEMVTALHQIEFE